MKTLRAEKVQTSDKSVELIAHDDHGEPFTVAFPPSVAAIFANSLGVAAREAGDETPLTIERRLRTTNRFKVDRTKSRNGVLEWVSWGFRHRIVIDRARIRAVADRLHDLADQLEDTA